jgi:CDP-diacylglycerol--serine O-phosphatidyltransferase
MTEMRKFRTAAAREGLLRQVRRQRLKYITVLPSLVTILNGVCGFAAIVFASKGDGMSKPLNTSYFAVSAYLILLAMVADMLDGRLARMSQSTSSFGGQLDSLCDVISFGLAPAFLMLKVMESKLGGIEQLNPVLESFLLRFIWLTAAVFVSCAAIRLARFNVENEEDESAHMSFMGLPTPAAAGVIASLVIFQQETSADFAASGFNAQYPYANILIYTLPFLAVWAAILMVSRIRYPHIVNQYIRGKKPFSHLIRVLLFLGLIIWSKHAALLLIFMGFAVSGFAKWLYFKVIKKPAPVPEVEQTL